MSTRSIYEVRYKHSALSISFYLSVDINTINTVYMYKNVFFLLKEWEINPQEKSPGSSWVLNP